MQCVNLEMAILLDLTLISNPKVGPFPTFSVVTVLDLVNVLSVHVQLAQEPVQEPLHARKSATQSVSIVMFNGLVFNIVWTC